MIEQENEFTNAAEITNDAAANQEIPLDNAAAEINTVIADPVVESASVINGGTSLNRQTLAAFIEDMKVNMPERYEQEGAELEKMLSEMTA